MGDGGGEDPPAEQPASPSKDLPLPAVPVEIETEVRWDSGRGLDSAHGTRGLPSEPWTGVVRAGQLAENDWFVSALCSIAAVAPAVLGKVRAPAASCVLSSPAGTQNRSAVADPRSAAACLNPPRAAGRLHGADAPSARPTGHE